jgi:hypothetical protein
LKPTSETTTDWYANVQEALASRRHKKTERGPAVHPGAFRHKMNPLAFNTSNEYMVLLDSAARLRDINRASYVRRALSLLVAHDLGMPIHQVLWETPCIGRWGKVQNRPGERDAGEGIENWCPHPDCDGDHLRLR